MATKNNDLWVKLLIGGLVGLAVILALMSNADPETDAWYEDDTVAASTVDEGPSDEADAWSATAEGDGGLPACDGTAPFSADGGTVRLPVDGPVLPFASTECLMDESHGSSDAVGLLQQAMVQCNGQAIALDGAYGSETRQAVEAVQAEHGIGVDGTYGPQTRAAMSWPATPADGDVATTTCTDGSGAG